MADDGGPSLNQQEQVRQIIAHIKSMPPWDGKTFDPKLSALLRDLQRTVKEQK